MELLESGSKILHEKRIEIVFVTLSESGIFISYKKDENIISKIIPGITRNVVDVSGAGDVVISVASLLINDINIEDIAKIANIAGGIVCEEVGVEPINKEKLLKEYYEQKI
jgi:bifunctional ADP-heptose synthase (sugar kinase/adenylyltransferase)